LLRQIAATAEVRTDTADHQHLHVIVDIRLVNQLGEAKPCGDGGGVELIGTVQSDGGDLGAAILLVQHGLLRRRSRRSVPHL
jgi:hypothetical protein